MKLTTMIILLLCISLTIGLFDNTGNVDPNSGEITLNDQQYNSAQNVSGELQESQHKSSLFWNWVLKPFDWSDPDFSFIAWFIILMGATLAGGVGYALLTQSYAPADYLYAVPYLALMSVGALPIIQLGQFLMRELNSYMCDPTITGYCYMPTLLAIVVCSSLAVTWFFTVLRAWRTGTE